MPNLYVTLKPEDAELLRTAAAADQAARDPLGIKSTQGLAELALGAISRAILRQGYQPRPTAAEIRDDPEGAALPANTIKVQLA